MSAEASSQVMPMIAVESVDAVRDFYVDQLGFSHVMGMVGKDGQLDFVSVVLGGARVMFSRNLQATAATGPGTPTAKQPVEIYLQVDDVDGYHNQVKKRGVKISDPLDIAMVGRPHVQSARPERLSDLVLHQRRRGQASSGREAGVIWNERLPLSKRHRSSA